MEIISLFEQIDNIQKIKIVDLLPRNASDRTSFNICYVVIASNQRTKEHRHDERESFFILKGNGFVDSEKNIQKVTAGDLLHFDPFESHSLINTSSEPLSFLTIYWRDYENAFRAAVKQKKQLIEPIFIMSGPPTPNGDLHLGHLSGPYLGADVCARYLKMKGREVYNISWSDDFQTGVLDKSYQLQCTPVAVANHFAEEIKSTLESMNIQIDLYLRPLHSIEYQKELSNFFYTLWQEGIFIKKIKTEFFDCLDHEFLNEGNIRGYCPNCAEQCAGDLCEECGHPHACVDIVDAISNRSNTKPITKDIERLYLPLNRFANDIKIHHDHATMRSRLRVLFDQLNAKKLPDFPVTYPSKWGVSVPLESYNNQMISVWFEMAFAFLFCIREIQRKSDFKIKNFSLPEKGKIIHFFGFDNSFYYTVLFPAIYSAAFPQAQLNIDYVCNEFYSLDEYKFSTSKGHAIWGKELLKKASSDEIRFYLAYTRPEIRKTNFTRKAFCEFSEKEFGSWHKWLSSLDFRVKASFNGKIPEAGLWTHEQKMFFSKMESYISEVGKSYEVDTFSLQRASKLICDFIEDSIAFSEGEKYWSTAFNSEPEFRTSIALEITAANLFALLVFPLMPEFSTNLWEQLGNKESLEKTSWPKIPPFAIAGAVVDLTVVPILKCKCVAIEK